MISEDKVTEIFYIADDFCKVFDAQMAKYTFKAERKRKYHRESRMSKAEIMVIMILFHSSGYRCLKHFYLEKTRWRQGIHWQASFRKALCGWHTTYNETEEQHEGSIGVRIRQTASQNEGYNKDSE